MIRSCSSAGDYLVLDEVIDESYIELTPYGEVDQGGAERARQAYRRMRSVFGDIKFEVEPMLPDGDLVFSRVMATVRQLNRGVTCIR